LKNDTSVKENVGKGAKCMQNSECGMLHSLLAFAERQSIRQVWAVGWLVDWLVGWLVRDQLFSAVTEDRDVKPKACCRPRRKTSNGTKLYRSIDLNDRFLLLGDIDRG
jgi:hypothetical protein